MIIFFFIKLGIYVTFLIFLTAFALSVPNPQVQTCREIHGEAAMFNNVLQLNHVTLFNVQVKGLNTTKQMH